MSAQLFWVGCVAAGVITVLLWLVRWSWMTPALRSLQITDWQRESETYLPPTTNYYSDFQWNNWMAFCQNAFWKCSPDSYLCITTWLHKKLTSESCAAPESKNKVPGHQVNRCNRCRAGLMQLYPNPPFVKGQNKLLYIFTLCESFSSLLCSL